MLHKTFFKSPLIFDQKYRSMLKFSGDIHGSYKKYSTKFLFQEYTFPPGASYTYFQLQYIDSRHYRRTTSISGSVTQYTLRWLRFEEVYNISIRAYFRYSGCYSSIYGEYSNNVTARTVETGDYHNTDCQN